MADTPRPDEDFALGDWLVRPSSREVTSAVGSTRLEPKVMEVLVYLAQRPGQLVTKEELLENVWKDTFVADGALFRHISELRRLLGDDSREPRYIETIPKSGYRLVASVSRPAPASPSASPPAPEAGPRLPSLFARARPFLLLAGPLLVALIVALLVRRSSPPTTPRPDRPRIAVLYFENMSGDRELGWLRSALVEMLVADLAQSPGLEILATDRLYPILREMGRGDDEKPYSADEVRRVAEKAGCDRVVLGSFVRDGPRLRIYAKLQDARSGRIVLAEKVEGPADAQLFAMVDELTERIKARLQTPPAADLERDLKDITTASLDAYRYYAEGINLHLRYQEDEARVLFEKAVEIDPDFAMALGKLSVIHYNIGQDRKSAEYAERALRRVDRLSPRERYAIEGWYYVRKEETLGRALEAYRKALEIYPDYVPARGNMGAICVALERYDDAIPQLEQLRRIGFPGFAPYLNLAKAYGAMGRFDEARRELLGFRERNPTNAAVHRTLGFQLIAEGKLDEALETMAKAEALDPAGFAPEWGRYLVALLRDRWDAAAASASKIAASSDPYWQWSGYMDRALLHLHRGRSRDALLDLERAVKSQAEPAELAALSHAAAAHVRLLRGEPELALQESKKAQAQAPGNPGEWHGLFTEALAEQARGRSGEADAAADRLGQKATLLPSEKEKRRWHHLLGELALARGDPARALAELDRAQSTLAPRGTLAGSELPPHVPTWFSLGSAHLAARDPEKAAVWLRKVTESGHERAHWPLPYARAFFLLGRALEARGQAEAARESYRRFVVLWGEGDLERAWVTEARAKAR